MIERNGHWEGCWQEPGHHDCAIRLVEGFRRRFEAAEIGQVENVAGCGRCVRVPRHGRPGDVVRLLRVEEPIEPQDTPARFLSTGVNACARSRAPKAMRFATAEAVVSSLEDP